MSGCKYVDLGVESFNEDILKFIKKGITQKQIYDAIGYLKKYNVPVKLNILIGTSPLETKETLKDTLRQGLKKLKVDQISSISYHRFPEPNFMLWLKKTDGSRGENMFRLMSNANRD